MTVLQARRIAKGRKQQGLDDPGYLSIRAKAKAWANCIYDPGPLFERDMFARVFAKGNKMWTEADVRQLEDAMFGDTIRKGGGSRCATPLVAIGDQGRFRIGEAYALGSMLMLTGAPGGACHRLTSWTSPDGARAPANAERRFQ